MRKIISVLFGVLAAAGIAFAPAASAAVTGSPFTAFDSNGALVTQTQVTNGEHFTYQGREVTAVMVIERSNGFGGYYWQFHTTPANVLGGTTGIVTLTPVS